MKLTPHVIDAMLAAGCTAEQIAAAVKAAMHQDDESQADRRERDRVRKREQRAREKNNENNDRVQSVTRTARDGADTPSDKEAPHTPKEINSPRSAPKGASLTPRAELETVLDADHAAAVVEHRQRLRKPLTARAAQLLAGKLSRCVDPNAAADAMVANGWQGFEPEWLESRTAPQQRATAPPGKAGKPTLASMWTDEAKAFGIIDEPASQQDRRLGTGLPGGRDQSPDFARRIAST
jgi:hypothetical protein